MNTELQRLHQKLLEDWEVLNTSEWDTTDLELLKDCRMMLERIVKGLPKRPAKPCPYPEGHSCGRDCICATCSIPCKIDCVTACITPSKYEVCAEWKPA